LRKVATLISTCDILKINTLNFKHTSEKEEQLKTKQTVAPNNYHFAKIVFTKINRWDRDLYVELYNKQNIQTYISNDEIPIKTVTW